MSALTTQEASERWCPFVTAQITLRNKKPGETTTLMMRTNDAGAVPPHSTCIGSRCMFWRWSSEPGVPRGYCGAAGPIAPLEPAVLAHAMRAGRAA